MRPILFLLLLPWLAVSELLDVKCCTRLSAPYVMRHDGTLSGLSIDYLHELERKGQLRCASLQIMNITWNAIVDYIAENPDRCELGVGPWSQSLERLSVHFLPPHTYAGLTLMKKRDNGNAAFFVTAFSPLVWLSVFALNAMFALLKVLDNRFAPAQEVVGERGLVGRVKTFLVKGGIMYRLRRAVQSVCVKMIGREGKVMEGEHTMRQWTLNFVIVICGVFVVLIYEAAMTAMLVQEGGEHLSGVDDLKTCRIYDGDVCFERGNSVNLFWQRAISHEECRQDGQNGEPRLFDSFDDVVQEVLAGRCKFAIGDTGHALLAEKKRCGKLNIVGNSFFQSGLSFITPVEGRALRGEELRRVTLQLREEGKLQDVEKYVGKCSERDAEVQLTLERLKVFFAITFGVCGVIFAEMVLDPQRVMWRKTEEQGNGNGQEGNSNGQEGNSNSQGRGSADTGDSAEAISDDRDTITYALEAG